MCRKHDSFSISVGKEWMLIAKDIVILLYCYIVVLLYCYIVVLLYCYIPIIKQYIYYKPMASLY
jgi:hypothetical protein